ncbi:MAG: electron transfer flavoprotein subunit beta/FixA family protein [Candidatus Lernaella stagnicola]|nr:electron transfer flavoprotein subunit beta/FixA family protein [Candidatus Lernaella stagnicola]
MNILVCVKQIVDVDAQLRIDANGRELATDPHTEYRLNRYDEYAVEAALRLREAAGRGSVAVASVGPPRVVQVLRRAMGMGADRGFHIAADANLDARSIAACLAELCRRERFDLVLAGVMSEDAMQSAVGPMIAALLDYPCVTNVVDMGLDEECDAAVTREVEGGRREIFALRFPALVTVQSGPNKPRYPKLSLMLRANQSEVAELSAVELDAGCRERAITKMEFPQQHRQTRFLAGDTSAKAAELARLLRERHYFATDKR